MDSDQSALKLSVIVIGYRSGSDCHRVIQDMQRQTIRHRLELILVSPDSDRFDSKYLDQFGGFRHVVMPKIQTSGQALIEGVRNATAPFVSYAEEHAYYSETWAERLVVAHEMGYDVVGFPIDNANPHTMTSWASQYDEFGPIVAPVKSGETNFLGGHHVSYRRQLLLDYGDCLADAIENEAALFLDLRAKGKPLYMAGDAHTRHVNISVLGAYVYTNYLGMRTFAAIRSKLGKWHWWKRAIFAFGSPLVPWIRLRRILADIKRTGRQEALLPGILFPLFPALCAGAFGEMLGYAFGAGDCAQHRALVELQRERFVLKDERELLNLGESSPSR